MLVRRVDYKLIYKDVDVTKYLKEDLLSLSYNENASGESDDLTITLKDDSKKWLKDWNPEQGDYIEATIKTSNWRYDNDKQSLFLGKFYIDEITPGGRPLEFGVGAISSPVTGDFLDRERNKTWEDANIKEISAEISNRYNLELEFLTSINYTISFLEQSNESDSSFLQGLCEKYGYSYKVFNNKMIIFMENEFEKKEPIKSFNENDLLSWSLSRTLSGTGYKKANIKYKGTDENEIDYTFSIGDGKTLYVNDVVDSLQEAEIVAKSQLRKYNKSQNTISFTLMGDLDLFATSTININDLGKYSGKYYIDKVSHSIGSNFTSSIEAHKVLEGY